MPITIQKVTDPLPELTGRRTANSKHFDMGKGKKRAEIYSIPCHYKNDYKDAKEAWKDIDTTWRNGRIDAAPYTAWIDGLTLHYTDKQTGESGTIALKKIGTTLVDAKSQFTFEGRKATIKDFALDLDLCIEAHPSGVKFSRIAKTDKAITEAQFAITGNPSKIRSRGVDADGGQLSLTANAKDGKLLESVASSQAISSLGIARPIKYPIRIDPAWSVGASTDDANRRLSPDYFSLTAAGIFAGAHYAAPTQYQQYGSGMRFLNITIPQGATITSAYLTIHAYASESGVVVRSRISAEGVDDAITFANDSAAFDARWAARTTARVDWDSIPAWTDGTNYNSPDIKTVIQEIVNRAGWASGNDIVIFWDDFEDRSDHGVSLDIREGDSWDDPGAYPPQLEVEYIVGWANIGKVNGVAASAIAAVNSISVSSIAKINGVAV